MKVAAREIKYRTYCCPSIPWQLLPQRRRSCFSQCWWSRRPTLPGVSAVSRMLVLAVLIRRAPHCHQTLLYASSKLSGGISQQRKSASAGISDHVPVLTPLAIDFEFRGYCSYLLTVVSFEPYICSTNPINSISGFALVQFVAR
jgi:hypothetical protein